jgi:hypothetical protein
MHTLTFDGKQYTVNGRVASYEEYMGALQENEEEELGLRQEAAQDGVELPPDRQDLELLDSDE